jgi:hypothetical protein
MYSKKLAQCQTVWREAKPPTAFMREARALNVFLKDRLKTQLKNWIWLKSEKND